MACFSTTISSPDLTSSSRKKVYGGTAEQLKSFNVNVAPPEDIWVHVDKENDVWFKQVHT